MTLRVHSLKACGARSVALLAMLCAVVGGPVAQLVRLAEIVPPAAGTGGRSHQWHAAAQPRFRLVLAGECNEAAQPAAASKDAAPTSDMQEKTKAPRLLKPVADQWESAARVQIDAGEIPAPAGEPYVPVIEPARVADATTVFYPSHSSPNPPARGPPEAF
ncbi:MAG: hypothetical protein NTW87_29140 [Planctomycetota bacterium]|nr:hypothetical protein [Planctomycetota bacterium]